MSTTADMDRELHADMQNLVLKLAPYVDAIVCYASTCDEHEPNRIAKDFYEVWRRVLASQAAANERTGS